MFGLVAIDNGRKECIVSRGVPGFATMSRIRDRRAWTRLYCLWYPPIEYIRLRCGYWGHANI